MEPLFPKLESKGHIIPLMNLYYIRGLGDNGHESPNHLRLIIGFMCIIQLSSRKGGLGDTLEKNDIRVQPNEGKWYGAS
mgnify:CR=1 FL=1